MIPALVLALAAGQFVPERDLPLALHGECIYPAALAQFAPGATPLLCQTVVATEEEVEFRQRQVPGGIHFIGTWHDGQLQLTSMQVRAGKPVDAQGFCKIYFANETISMVTCRADAGGQTYVGNFRKVTF